MPATIKGHNIRNGNTIVEGIISNECTFKSKVNYTLKPMEALSGVHLNITIAHVSMYTQILSKWASVLLAYLP